MKKLLLSLLFLMVIFLNSFSHATELENLKDKNISQKDIPKMDTLNWITVPIGRYLIKLPPYTKIEWEPLLYNSDYKLIWEKDLSIERANNILKKEADELAENKDLKVEYIENFGSRSRGTLLKYTSKTSEKPARINYKMYVVSNENKNFPERVYSFTYASSGGFEASLEHSNEEILKIQKEQEEFIYTIANNIWISDTDIPSNISLDTREGVYFNGGFLHIYKPSFYLIEESNIKCTFLQYPHIEFYLKIEHKNLENNNKEIFHISKENLYVFSKNNIKYYIFLLETDREKMNNPVIEITLKNKDVFLSLRDTGYYVAHAPNIESSSFSSDDEALSFWNAIKENIRWRPDGVHVPLPEEANGKPYFIVNDKIIPAEINK